MIFNINNWLIIFIANQWLLWKNEKVISESYCKFLNELLNNLILWKNNLFNESKLWRQFSTLLTTEFLLINKIFKEMFTKID